MWTFVPSGGGSRGRRAVLQARTNCSAKLPVCRSLAHNDMQKDIFAARIPFLLALSPCLGRS
jgi:hypothetical protein